MALCKELAMISICWTYEQVNIKNQIESLYFKVYNEISFNLLCAERNLDQDTCHIAYWKE